MQGSLAGESSLIGQPCCRYRPAIYRRVCGAKPLLVETETDSAVAIFVSIRVCLF